MANRRLKTLERFEDSRHQVVSLFALGLCVAPFAMAAPAQHSKMKTYNAEAIAKGLGEGKATSGRCL